ncbi:PDDEXK-like [Arabidopsis thaliana x Arabidopsis arenosa]|uniref:PDDEXK-like n=1 Tax=Arabidopsis thaliana x Arabidopsis arenosa TaxID=1240361 RepID=A0A8T2BMU9_9BRAS|nr:PDDEXK-like [Arabidopsis thaliana x Arabidopsis arenosa]
MGSLGEEDLEKLVLDYIESSPITVSDHLETSPTALITLEEILRKKGEEEKEMEEKIKSFMKRGRLSYEGDDEKRDVMNKIVSKLRSDGYDASLSQTSWNSSIDHSEGSRVFRCSRKYEYIDVMVKGGRDGDGVSKLNLIIDLDFKSQFELAKQTQAYKDMTEMLPKVFVATEWRLRRVVSLVCGEMKKSMEKEGMSRPPWRSSRYMLSKWLPENRRRVSGCKKVSWSVFDDGGEGKRQARSWTVSGGGPKTKCCFPIF